MILRFQLLAVATQHGCREGNRKRLLRSHRPFSFGRQGTVHVIPAYLQSQPHQVRPMRAPAQILGGFIGSGFTAATSANERAAPDAILTGSLSADNRYAEGVERPPAAYRQTPHLPFLNPQHNKSVNPRPGGGPIYGGKLTAR
jgi:hypothetical protein